MSITPVDPLETYTEFFKKNSQEQWDKAKANNETVYNNQIDTVKDLYSGQIAESGQQYSDLERQNSVQKLINERQVAERMANLGLTDSGLNRTQQTAVQLSAANNAAEIARQRQSVIDNLNREMTAKITELESAKSTAAANIDSSYEQMINENAVNARSDDLDSYNALEKARIEADTARIKAQLEADQNKKSSDYSKLYSHLTENNDDPDYVARLIDEYATLYNIDENGPEMQVLLKAGGITADELARYVDSGSIYSEGKDYQLYIEQHLPTGRVNWNYKTDGKQTYKIEIVKATKNFGNFGGLLDTVDGNDVVNIYYPDETLLAANVKLTDLTKENGLAITHLTAGKSAGLQKYDLSLDLSSENFK